MKGHSREHTQSSIQRAGSRGPRVGDEVESFRETVNFSYPIHPFIPLRSHSNYQPTNLPLDSPLLPETLTLNDIPLH